MNSNNKIQKSNRNKILTKNMAILMLLLTVSLGGKNVYGQIAKDSLTKSDKDKLAGSRIADSYEANTYYLYNKSGDDTGRRGGITTGSTTCEFFTEEEDTQLKFKIGSIEAFSIFKGTNGDPTFYGYNAGWSRFVANGAIAFFGGQPKNTQATPHLFVSTAGNIGIGTNSPNYKMQLNSPANNFGFVQTTGTHSLGIRINTSSADLGTLSATPLNFLANNQILASLSTTGNFGIGTTDPAEKLEVNGNAYLRGKVGIATNFSQISSTNLSNYSLFVNKGILSENYALGSQTSWADYVFYKDYHLLSISELENFIQKMAVCPIYPLKIR